MSGTDDAHRNVRRGIVPVDWAGGLQDGEFGQLGNGGEEVVGEPPTIGDHLTTIVVAMTVTRLMNAVG